MKLKRRSDGKVERCQFRREYHRLIPFSKQEKTIIILRRCLNLQSTHELCYALGSFQGMSRDNLELVRELIKLQYLDRFRTELDEPYYYVTLPPGEKYLKQISGEDKVGKLPGLRMPKKPSRCSCGKYRKMEILLCKRCWAKVSPEQQQALPGQILDLKNQILNEFRTKFVIK